MAFTPVTFKKKEEGGGGGLGSLLGGLIGGIATIATGGAAAPILPALTAVGTGIGAGGAIGGLGQGIAGAFKGREPTIPDQIPPMGDENALSRRLSAMESPRQSLKDAIISLPQLNDETRSSIAEPLYLAYMKSVRGG